MSLSRPQSDNPNPAKKFIEFKGSTGEFVHYDKEKGENVQIDKPIRFTVLDELSAITGYSDENQCGIYSNEVHKTTTEPLTVKAFKSKGGQIAKGIYQEIKGDIKAAGGKYAKSIYAYMNGELVNFKLYGASLSPWIDKEIDTSKQSIEIKGCEKATKGSNEYYVPIIEGIDMLDEEAAREADEVLQKYLDEKKVDRIQKDTEDESVEFQEKYDEFDPDPPATEHLHKTGTRQALKDFETGAKPEPREASTDLPFDSSLPSL